MRAMTWIKEVLREDCAVAVAVAVGTKPRQLRLDQRLQMITYNDQTPPPPSERRSSKRMRERSLGRQSKRKFGVEKKKALKEGALS